MDLTFISPWCLCPLVSSVKRKIAKRRDSYSFAIPFDSDNESRRLIIEKTVIEAIARIIVIKIAPSIRRCLVKRRNDFCDTNKFTFGTRFAFYAELSVSTRCRCASSMRRTHLGRTVSRFAAFHRVESQTYDRDSAIERRNGVFYLTLSLSHTSSWRTEARVIASSTS